MADTTAGLQVINVSNPGQPSLEWTWPTSDTAFHVAATGAVAAVATGPAGVEVVQVFEETLTAAPAALNSGPVLRGNSPNPFNPVTTIRYVPGNGEEPLEIVVHDLAARCHV